MHHLDNAMCLSWCSFGLESKLKKWVGFIFLFIYFFHKVMKIIHQSVLSYNKKHPEKAGVCEYFRWYLTINEQQERLQTFRWDFGCSTNSLAQKRNRPLQPWKNFIRTLVSENLAGLFSHFEFYLTRYFKERHDFKVEICSLHVVTFEAMWMLQLL